MRRRRQRKAVLLYLLFILLVLVLAWWMAGDYYKPYPPATPTPTPGYWPTRITATIIPSATITEVIVTPIQPTIGYTETPMQPTVTTTHTPTITATLILPTIPAPTETPMPILYTIVKDKQSVCVTYFIRPWGVKIIPRCWTYRR